MELLLHFRLPHLRLDLFQHLRLDLFQSVQLVGSVKPWLLLMLPRPRFLRIVQLNERDDVRLRLGLEVSSKAAVGRDSLVLRGLSVLLSFLGEVQLVIFDPPPFCYSGLAIQARQARRRFCVSTCPRRPTYSSYVCSWALRGCYACGAYDVLKCSATYTTHTHRSLVSPCVKTLAPCQHPEGSIGPPVPCWS